MTDRPIIFSGPMTRALLDGRKTQTRRLLNPQPVWEPSTASTAGFTLGAGWSLGQFIRCGEDTIASAALGAVRFAAGDRVYERENFQLLSFGDYLPTKARPADVRFAATDPCADLPVDARGYPWRPCIHMPRWASRLTLFVEAVRVQRLQDISEEDARAEGIEHSSGRDDVSPGWRNYCDPNWRYSLPTGRSSFATLWDSLHTEPGTRWDDNPWIYALTFRVERGNIDQMEAANG